MAAVAVTASVIRFKGPEDLPARVSGPVRLAAVRATGLLDTGPETDFALLILRVPPAPRSRPSSRHTNSSPAAFATSRRTPNLCVVRGVITVDGEPPRSFRDSHVLAAE